MTDLPVTIPGLTAGDRTRVIEVLGRAKELGYLGPGPVEDQVDRSLALLPVLLAAVGGTGPRGEMGEVGPHLYVGEAFVQERPSRSVKALDLGSGGGVPGLALAMALPHWDWVLLDGSVGRCRALSEAVARLGLGARAVVVAARAEEVAQGPLRSSFDIVVSRSFAAAAPTAECAAPFLRVGGALLVTEPPGGCAARWPPEHTSVVGLTPEAAVAFPVAVQILRQRAPCPSRYPRRTGVPVKRPLWLDPSHRAVVSRET